MLRAEPRFHLNASIRSIQGGGSFLQRRVPRTWSLGGHKDRLDRDLKNRFGSKNYAAEELVAELCAAFLCAEFGFDGDLRHAGYIEHWIELLKADKRAFFTACSQASKAADYLRGLALAEPTRGPTHYGGKLAPHCRSGNNRRYAELPIGPNVRKTIAPRRKTAC